MRTVSYILFVILIIIFFSSLNFYDTHSELVNYLARSFYHANITHLIANLFTFYNLFFIEDVIGSGHFLIAILFIWLVSSILLYFVHKTIPSRKVYTVGFSGIIFGLIVLYYYLANRGLGLTIGGLIIAILPQLFVKNVSFDGHVCGIIAGALYVFLFKPAKYVYPLPKAK